MIARILNPLIFILFMTVESNSFPVGTLALSYSNQDTNSINNKRVHPTLEGYTPQDNERFLYLFSVDNQSGHPIHCRFQLFITLSRVSSFYDYDRRTYSFNEHIILNNPNSHIYMKEITLFQDKTKGKGFKTKKFKKLIHKMMFIQHPFRISKNKELPSNKIERKLSLKEKASKSYDRVEFEINTPSITYRSLLNNKAHSFKYDWSYGSLLNRSYRIDPFKFIGSNILIEDGIRLYEYLLPNLVTEFNSVRNFLIFCDENHNLIDGFYGFPKELLQLILLKYWAIKLKESTKLLHSTDAYWKQFIEESL